NVSPKLQNRVGGRSRCTRPSTTCIGSRYTGVPGCGVARVVDGRATGGRISRSTNGVMVATESSVRPWTARAGDETKLGSRSAASPASDAGDRKSRRVQDGVGTVISAQGETSAASRRAHEATRQPAAEPGRCLLVLVLLFAAAHNLARRFAENKLLVIGLAL